MSPIPSTRRAKASPLQQILRRLVLRLILLLDAMLGDRAARLRARLDARPTHRHARAHARELARLARVRATLADPHLFDDPRMIGCAAEAARVRNDPGRRALARRRIHPNPFFALPKSRPSPRAELEPPEGRCTTKS